MCPHPPTRPQLLQPVNCVLHSPFWRVFTLTAEAADPTFTPCPRALNIIIGIKYFGTQALFRGQRARWSPVGRSAKRRRRPPDPRVPSAFAVRCAKHRLETRGFIRPRSCGGLSCAQELELSRLSPLMIDGWMAPVGASGRRCSCSRQRQYASARNCFSVPDRALRVRCSTCSKRENPPADFRTFPAFSTAARHIRCASGTWRPGNDALYFICEMTSRNADM